MLNHATIKRLLFASRFAILLALCAHLAQAKPMRGRSDQYDPLMALPSDRHPQPASQQHQTIVVEQAVPPQTEVHYVYANPSLASSDHQQSHRAAGQQEVQLEYQQLPPGAVILGPNTESAQGAAPADGSSPYHQLIQVSADPNVGHPQHQHQHEGVDCNKRHEYSSLISLNDQNNNNNNNQHQKQDQILQLQQPQTELQQQQQQQQPQPQAQAQSDVRGEYPGEILYIGQNGELDSRREVSDAAGSLAQSSGLPATILTEIPVNDMPLDVLEKLKREYGVKVVATRERPGANLVINCDDYVNQENSICQRQQAAQAPREQPGVPVEPTYVAYQSGVVQPEHEQEHHHHHHHNQQHQHHELRNVQQYHHHQQQQQQHHKQAGQVLQSEGPNVYVGHPTTSTVELTETTRPIEYVPVDASGHHTRAPTSPMDQGHFNSNGAEAYGSRTTASLDEQTEAVASPPPQDTQGQGDHHPGGSGHQTAAGEHSSAHEAVTSSIENDPQHAGFDEQPKSIEYQQDVLPKEATTYQDRH